MTHIHAHAQPGFHRLKARVLISFSPNSKIGRNALQSDLVLSFITYFFLVSGVENSFFFCERLWVKRRWVQKHFSWWLLGVHGVAHSWEKRERAPTRHHHPRHLQLLAWIEEAKRSASWRWFYKKRNSKLFFWSTISQFHFPLSNPSQCRQLLRSSQLRRWQIHSGVSQWRKSLMLHNYHQSSRLWPPVWCRADANEVM